MYRDGTLHTGPTGTLREILLLKNCGNFQVCYPSLRGVLTERVGPEKHLKQRF